MTAQGGPRDAALVLVVLGVAAAVAVTALAGVRPGAAVLGGVLGACALARAVLPVRAVGALAVRSRVLDVVLLAALAVLVVVLAGSVPLGP